jgi:hypothetical protein
MSPVILTTLLDINMPSRSYFYSHLSRQISACLGKSDGLHRQNLDLFRIRIILKLYLFSSVYIHKVRCRYT